MYQSEEGRFFCEKNNTADIMRTKAGGCSLLLNDAPGRDYQKVFFGRGKQGIVSFSCPEQGSADPGFSRKISIRERRIYHGGEST